MRVQRTQKSLQKKVDTRKNVSTIVNVVTEYSYIKLKGGYVQELRKCRERAGYTAQVAATKLGVSISALFSWEKGERSPNGRVLVDMAKLYGCSADELLGMKR